jgi:hypothetical protein
MKKTHQLRQLQQGDVTLTKLAKLPEGIVSVVSRKRCVVAHGESGHSHVIEDDEAQLIQIGDRMLLKLSKGTTLKHEEHKGIKLSAGIWEVGRVREFDYFQQMTRQVVD